MDVYTSSYCFFFFQAEDGIRDLTVTGVQTCALPISGARRLRVISGPFEATTVVAVRHRDQVAVAGDGQVSIGNTIVKAGAKKVRKLYHDRILAGFAGTAADAFTLFSRFESRLDEHRGNLARAAVEVAKDWRTDRVQIGRASCRERV